MNSWIRLKLEAVRLSSQSLAGISTVLEFPLIADPNGFLIYRVARYRESVSVT